MEEPSPDWRFSERSFLAKAQRRGYFSKTGNENPEYFSRVFRSDAKNRKEPQRTAKFRRKVTLRGAEINFDLPIHNLCEPPRLLCASLRNF